MKKVLIKIKGQNNCIENVKFMTLDEIKEVYPLEGETEEDIADALDILSEDMPGYFANSKGKVKYSFELFDEQPKDDSNIEYREIKFNGVIKVPTSVDLDDETLDAFIPKKED